ncbi:hypothetical protein SAMD00019534_034610 [Acytostelium subglobosum LB1]|uniref:hypothetical protein n=1 Tax=Acytostelium subglobosum LB1 TaxID=1410327 RepID=UPI000644ACFB|nr:hypothetical protein SAMD00019534_034610 [Acytostelium subglobosum LB1]GAM20286.1 hypothetical protein SAMD00019534_034610 [Acytostelium subglobosum LB1]|eukprot:XP_012759807.1 hypothetical protein SAMD00019534_034610 [Acytostelium subglobosum LB1]
MPSFPPKLDPSCRKAYVKCKPLHSMIDLLTWTPDVNVPVSCIPLANIPQRRQQIIHCHDMMGGYLDHEVDSFNLTSMSSTNNHYLFQHWQLIDIFIYFTHQCITIPPVSWIECAHKNGVKVMGTVITEWEQGIKDACRLVRGPYFDPDNSDGDDRDHSIFIRKLVDIAKHYRFDGWFINIESPLPSSEYGVRYQLFLGELTRMMHEEIPGSLMIWYDSVTTEGALKWQNELNVHNKAFFDQCDGIFLNYKWDESMIKQSAILAGSTSHQIYVGTDVWGRGTFGGGHFNSHIGVEKAIENGMSAALFAPGWTFESNKSSKTISNLREATLWTGVRGRQNLIKNGSANNNMDGWIVEMGDAPCDGWGVDDGGINGGKAFVSSHEWSSMSQEVDLEVVASTDILSSSPVIELEFYHCGTGPKYNDLLRVKLEVRDISHKVLITFESGDITTQKDYKRFRHTISEYPSGARYINLIFTGKDVERWAGRFGSRITEYKWMFGVWSTSWITIN